MSQVREARDYDAAVALAEELLAGEQPAAALDMLGLALEQREGDPHALRLVGRAFLQTGELLRAQKAFLQAARAEPDDPWCYAGLAEVLLRRGDPARALRVIERGARAGSADPVFEALTERARRALGHHRSEPAASASVDEPAQGASAAVDGADAPEAPAAAPKATSTSERGPAPSAPEPETIPAPPRASMPSASPPTERPYLVEVKPDPASAPAFHDDDDEPTRIYRSEPDDIEVFASEEGSEPQPLPVGERVSNVRTEPGLGDDAPPPRAGGVAAAQPSSRPGPEPASSPPAPEPDAASRERLRDFTPITGTAAARSTSALDDEDALAGARVRSRPSRGRLLWLVAALVVAAGVAAYFYYEANRARQRKAEAAQRIEQASAALRIGDATALSQALDLVEQARAQDPSVPGATRVELLAAVERALTHGAFDSVPLDKALSALAEAKVDAPVRSAAQTVAALLRGNLADARAAAGAVTQNDPPLLRYIDGAVQYYLGMDGADAMLASAASDGVVQAGLLRARVHVLRHDLAAADHDVDEAMALAPRALDPRLMRAYLDAGGGRTLERSEAAKAAAEAAVGRIEHLDHRLEASSPAAHVLASLVRARAAALAGDTSGAKAQLQAAKETPVGAPDLLTLIGLDAVDLGAPALARDVTSVAVARLPDHASYRWVLARAMVGEGDARGALDMLAALPLEPETLELRARIVIETGDVAAVAKTADVLDDYTTAHKDAPAELRALGLRLDLRRGASAEALLPAARAMAAEPGAPADVTLAFAEVQLRAGHADAALEALRGRPRLLDTNAAAALIAGEAYRAKGDGAKAAEAFERALRLAPSDERPARHLGRILLDEGHYEAAEQAYAAALERHPKATFAMLGRVEALTGLGKLDQAEALLGSLSDDARNSAEGAVAQALIDLARNDPAQAAATLEPVVSGDQPTARAFVVYGDAQLRAGRVAKASAAYRGALSLEPDDPGALVGEAAVLLARHQAGPAMTAADRALGVVETAIRPPSLDARLWLVRGRAQLESGFLPEARVSLDKAANAPDAPAEAWFYLGDALSGVEPQASKAAYQKYLSLAPRGPMAARARRAAR
ncbi:MAG: tetratricopeptide repeat protein [Myxococcales bacterium]|nr:tetratricopeptide repeat protein [Myxococcales bacterium]